jgi:cytochrome c oxidase subunit 2
MRAAAQVIASETWPPPTLRPAGPFAAPLAEITWVMLTVGIVVLVIVLVILALALTNAKARRIIKQPRTIVIGGIIFPVVVLTASLAYGLWTSARIVEPPPPTEMRIRVIGEMWWWRVIYFDGERPLFETANEIRIPVGQPVTLELESADVIHSFWVPELAPKLDMIPGRRNVLRAQADRAGIYRGQCTEFCGAAHALMAFEVIAVTPAEFEAWRTAQTAPAGSDGAHAEAQTLFREVGCAACHVIRGSEANGRVGPDLTHLASRRTLGAGILPNDRPTLHRWVRNANDLKPGVRMPSYEQLSADDLEALTLYLGSLR